MRNSIGQLDWDACDKCRHYRPGQGGCIPMDEYEERGDSPPLDISNSYWVICAEFAEKDETEIVSSQEYAEAVRACIPLGQWRKETRKLP